MCHIEVKASLGDGTEPFPMTAREWEKAQECHQSKDSVYIILRIAHAAEKPQIVDRIIDPFGLYLAGQLNYKAHDMWVYVGAAKNPSNMPTNECEK